MKKHPILSRLSLACLFACSATAFAGNPGYTPGTVSTLGKVSHPGTIMSSMINPASGEILVNMDESNRFGFGGAFFQLEIGAVDSFLTQVEELQDDLKNEEMTLNDALDSKEKFDALLPEFGENGRLSQSMGLSFPFMPFAYRSDVLNGVITFDFSVAQLGDGQFLDDPIQIEVANEQINLLTSSAIYIKSAIIASGSVAYSRNVWESQTGDYMLYAGGKANLHYVGLNKQLIALQNLLEDQDVETAIEEEFKDNSGLTAELGVDLGLLWTAPNAQLGVTVLNVNEPEFAYGTIGENCLEIDSIARQSNCFIAQQVFSDEIALQETAIMSAKTIVEGAIYTEDRKWLISGSAELNSTYDLVGRESQYVTVSASYSSDGYILPSLRFGATKNLAGSELTTVSGGTTLFGMVNFDLMFSLDTIKYEGNEIPRLFSISLGIEEKF